MFKPQFRAINSRLLPGEASNWPLNEGAGTTVWDSNFHTSSLGTRLSGTFNSTVSWVTDYKRGFVISAGGGYIDLGNIASPGTKNFSFTVWVNMSTSFGTTNPGIMGRRKVTTTTASTGWSINVNTTVGATTFGVPYAEVTDGTNIATTSGTTTDTPVITDGNWHLLAGVVNKTSNLLKLSVDAQAFATVSISAVGSLSDTANFQIATVGNTDTTAYTGFVSDVRYMENRSLTLAEIYRIYNEKPPIYQQKLMPRFVGMSPIELRVDSLYAEVLLTNPSSLQVGGVYAETLGQNTAPLQIGALTVEVLQSSTAYYFPISPVKNKQYRIR